MYAAADFTGLTARRRVGDFTRALVLDLALAVSADVAGPAVALAGRRAAVPAFGLASTAGSALTDAARPPTEADRPAQTTHDGEDIPQ